MISAVIGLATVLVDWRQRGILRRLKLTPIPLAEFFAARITASLVVAVMQVVVLLAFGRVVVRDPHLRPRRGRRSRSRWPGACASSRMGFAIGSIVSNPETGDAVSNVITNPMMFLSGVFFPVAAMPSFVQVIARVLPLYYLANGLRDTTVQRALAHACRRRHRGTLGGDGGAGGGLASYVPLGTEDLGTKGVSMRYQNVIVGGGLAGGMVAQEYREQGGDGSVLIVAREPTSPTTARR